jgi:Carboxypeptidase regulatory-like domain
MPRLHCAFRAILGLLLIFCTGLAGGQQQASRASSDLSDPVRLMVVDENGQAVPGAEVTILEPEQSAVQLWTDYDGRCSFVPRQSAPYQIRAQKPGFYQTVENGIETGVNTVRIVLAHEQIVREQVNVTASVPGIDTQQTSDQTTMNTPEIVNIPYQTSRDIRYLLPFNPGVVQDATEQVHVAGSETWETLDEIDGFDIRSPVNGVLSMRISPDAVRTIDAQTTRYPVEYGRATGGVIAFYTGMGDNKFRFNATNFIPSFRELNGIRFDKFVPRFTYSGPLVRNRAWFYDGLETEYDNIYIAELPANANTDRLIRGSNLIKIQANLTPANILTGGLLFNDYHSPYDGISSLTPQQSTTKRDTIAWLPYLRDKLSFSSGALLDVGAAVARFRDGYEPHGSAPYDVTPELPSGSYFENLTGLSQRVEGTAALYLPPRHWAGQHDLKLGLDLDHIGYSENVARAPVSYLREDKTLLRRSDFPATEPFTLRNAEVGAYLQDRWQPCSGLLVEPGLRIDWDEIIRRPLVSPRIAAVYAPPGSDGTTKLSAGIGLYYEHTQLEYLTRALAGVRSDTYYAADGVTPTGPPRQTTFTANYGSLREARALNWSLGIERKLPWSIFAGANFIQKRTSNAFTYVNQSGPSALSGNYLLTNQRQDHYNSFEFDARRLFADGYTLYVSYTRSSARTNAALNYMPTLSLLGPQQSGPLAWDTPNRTISWGWLPVPLPKLRKRWDFVYDLNWQTGFTYTPVNANRQVAGAAGSQRFPNYINFSPGLEWKFHFRGAYLGLRGVMENAMDRANPAEVNNVVDSPQYGTFSELQGRAFTARIRLIGAK